MTAAGRNGVRAVGRFSRGVEFNHFELVVNITSFPRKRESPFYSYEMQMPAFASMTALNSGSLKGKELKRQLFS
jgi:hypothetical protein